MSYFDHESAAARYARARPNFHPLVVALIDEKLPGTRPLARALDVGCGTGQSTEALRSLAGHVVGIDPSLGMLSQCHGDEQACYLAANAETLPFSPGSFDLITVGLAFHCFDQNRFLAEACRVLRTNGWLAIYNSYFCGTMVDQPLFKEWIQEEYLKRFPTPAKQPIHPSSESTNTLRLRAEGQKEFRNEVSFDMADLIDYLTTQSNVIAKVEEGEAQLGEISAWMAETLYPIMGNKREQFEFGGGITFWRAT